MKAAGAELKTAFKKSDLNIDGIEKLQDEMADLMVRIGVCCCATVVINIMVICIAVTRLIIACQSAMPHAEAVMLVEAMPRMHFNQSALPA